MLVCLWFLFNAINHSSHTLITLERSNLPSAPLTLQERGNSSVMMPELLLLVGQGSERFFSSENKTKQKNPGSNVKSLLNLFGADDLSNWNGFWKQSWELG